MEATYHQTWKWWTCYPHTQVAKCILGWKYCLVFDFWFAVMVDGGFRKKLNTSIEHLLDHDTPAGPICAHGNFEKRPFPFFKTIHPKCLMEVVTLTFGMTRLWGKNPSLLITFSSPSSSITRIKEYTAWSRSNGWWMGWNFSNSPAHLEFKWWHR